MEILQNFSLNQPYKFILYLSSIILVLSFVVKPSDIDINKLRIACFLITTCGVIVWKIDERYTNEMIDKDERGAIYDEDYVAYKRYTDVLNFFYFIISFTIIVLLTASNTNP